MKKSFLLNADGCYLHFPIKNTTGAYVNDKAYRYVKILNGNQLISEVYIKLSQTPDFYAPRYFKGYESITLECEDKDVPESFFDGIKVGESMEKEKELYPQLYSEKYRNQIHFSAGRGWLNDPNGLVYANQKYHMYFQHNPLGTIHGGVNISWGHATSTDGVCWKETHDAIYNRNAEQEVASGSAWCDEKNLFGYGENVIFSAHTELNGCYFKSEKQPQTEGQFLMYSTDDGQTFVNLGKNPKIKVAEGEFWRDPKLLVIDDTMLMLVYETFEKKDCVTVYASKNLDDWEYKSRSMNLYECPDLFLLPVKETGEQKWILYGGDGSYSVCEFENYHIKKESTCGFLDYGWAVYAGQTFNNHPEKDKRYHLAWVVHGWDNDLADYEGKPFSQCMSLLCTLELHRTKGGYRLFRKPCEQLRKLRIQEQKGCFTIENKHEMIVSDPCELAVIFQQTKDFQLELGECRLAYTANDNKVIVTGYSMQYNKEKDKLELVEDCKKNKEYFFSEIKAPVLDIFVDKTVTEIFMNEEISITVPTISQEKRVIFTGQDLAAQYVQYELHSIWNFSFEKYVKRMNQPIG